jgi:hypothetical protein
MSRSILLLGDVRGAVTRNDQSRSTLQEGFCCHHHCALEANMPLEELRIYAIKPDVTNSILGSGTYESWLKILDAFAEEQTRADTNLLRFKDGWAASMRQLLDSDLTFALQVCDDYGVFLERASSNGYAHVADGENMLNVLMLAVSILTYVNDVMDKMFALGIVATLNGLAAFALQLEVIKLQKVLKKLMTELERAKREVKEAWAQLGINTVIAGVLLFSGPLGWVTLGAIGIGQMATNAYLGPSVSDSAKAGRFATSRLGNAMSFSDKILGESSKVVRIAKPGGKFVPIIGIAFDAQEIAVGYSNVDVLKAYDKEAKEALEALVAKVQMQKAVINGLLAKFEELHQDVLKRGENWIATTRQSLEEEMRRTGYRPRV